MAQFTVAFENVDALVGKLSMLARKASKLGCGEITWSHSAPRPGKVTELGYGGKSRKVHTVVVDFTVNGTAPSLNGWSFLATLEHTSSGNLVRSIGGEVPECYRTAKAFCDHCGKVRSRKDTYLVRNDAGNVKQVGKSCLKDFTGHDSPEKVVALAEYLIEAYSECEDAGLEGFGSNGPSAATVSDYLPVVAAYVRVYGYKSGKACSEGEAPTSQSAWLHLFDRGAEDCVTDEDRKIANDAMAWVAATDATSDYIHNLKVAIANGVVTERTKAIVASVIPAFTGDQVRKAAPSAPSEYVGTVGQKHTATVTLRKHFGYVTEYGWMSTYIFADASGNVFVWKTSTDQNLTEGHTYNIAGTVKAHSVYRETKQTALTRCKLTAAAKAA